MTNELGPASRALLGAARDGLGPDAATIARMRGKIDVAVTAAAVGSATGSTAAITGAGSLASKLGLAALVAIVVGTGSAVATRDRPAAATQIASFETVDPPVHTATTARELVGPPATAVVRVKTAAVTGSTSRTAGIDLAREVELVDRASLALRNGDPKGALAAVSLHATETANRGQLAEDAAAIEIEARCKLGEPIAARLAAFDARWGSSAQRTRLATATRSCR